MSPSTQPPPLLPPLHTPPASTIYTLTSLSLELELIKRCSKLSPPPAAARESIYYLPEKQTRQDPGTGGTGFQEELFTRLSPGRAGKIPQEF